MKAKSIAILLTVHNRRDKTLKCLECLYRQLPLEEFTADIYLTDDGCTDGTSEAVQEAFPNVHILSGDGNLYWNQGMRLAWDAAAKEKEINDLKSEMSKLKIETSEEINELKKQNEILREKIEKQNVEFNNLKEELKTMKIIKEDNINDKSTNKKPSGNLFGKPQMEKKPAADLFGKPPMEKKPATNLFTNQNKSS